MAKTDIDSAQKSTKGTLSTTQNQANQNLNPASSGYQNFAATGGITPQQQQLTRVQAQQGVAGLYDSMKQNLDRQKAIQGGYSPGFGANEAQLARQGSASASNAVNSADLGLLQQIQQGKLAGLGGLTNIGGLYQGQVPQELGIQAQLAEAKPSWWQNIQGGLGAIGGIGKSLGGILAGAGSGGLSGALTGSGAGS